MQQLIEFGKYKFGENVFHLSRYSDETKQRVQDMQDNFDRTQYDQHRKDDPMFDAYEFVHYQEDLINYSISPSMETSERIAKHTYRRRFYDPKVPQYARQNYQDIVEGKQDRATSYNDVNLPVDARIWYEQRILMEKKTLNQYPGGD